MMGAEEAGRLMRGISDPAVQTLVQELYSVIQSLAGGTLKGPVRIRNESDEPALTVENYGTNQTAVDVRRDPINANSGTNIAMQDGAVTPYTDGEKTDPKDTTKKRKVMVQQPLIQLGTIASGQGNLALVNILATSAPVVTPQEKDTRQTGNNTQGQQKRAIVGSEAPLVQAKTTTQLMVNIIGVDANEKFGAGYPVIVFFLNGSYYGVVPIWQAEAS